MSEVVLIITILFYISLGLELTLWHVPSVVSTANVLNPKPEIVDTFGEESKKVFTLQH